MNIFFNFTNFVIAFFLFSAILTNISCNSSHCTCVFTHLCWVLCTNSFAILSPTMFFCNSFIRKSKSPTPFNSAFSHLLSSLILFCWYCSLLFLLPSLLSSFFFLPFAMIFYFLCLSSPFKLNVQTAVLLSLLSQ